MRVIDRLRCWLGRHAWHFEREVYTQMSWVCARCGHRDSYYRVDG